MIMIVSSGESSSRESERGKTTPCEDSGKRGVIPALERPIPHTAITRPGVAFTIGQSASFVGCVMSNIPVAFFVLGAFFVLYLVAALWRSRPK